MVGVLAAAAPLLLAGVLPIGPSPAPHWYRSGAWIFPVGNALDYTRSDSAGEAGYLLRRNLRSGGHQGADLSNLAALGEVRAAAHGLVVHCVTSKGASGYGCHVVLAHRSPGQGLFYSVYAHLASGSVTVSAGQVVVAGQRIGRVGRTGRATSAHLHFEIRRPRSPWERWELAPVLDPIEFVSERLPRGAADTSWAAPFLVWAQCAGLLEGEAAHDSVTRLAWRRILAEANRDSTWSFLERPQSQEPDSARGPKGALGWAELAKGFEELAGGELDLPPAPLDADLRGARCRSVLGADSPAEALRRHRKRGTSRPTAAEVCLLLSLLRGD